MKQTAVEWYFTELWSAPKDKFIWHSILEKAKEMEKEQIKEAWIQGGGYSSLSQENDRMLSEQYYTETYGKK